MSSEEQPAKAGGDVLIDGLVPLMAPGTYLLKFIDWDTLLYNNRQPKVVLRFTVLSPGPHFEQKVSRWYNAKSLIGRPGRNGRFKAGRGCELLRDYVIATDSDPRRDRIALTRLRPMLLQGEIATVTHDRKQRLIPEPLRYSVVRSLRRVDP